jgi:hypothetical protein
VKRNAAAVLVALAATVGLVDPYACRRYSMEAAQADAAGAAVNDRVPPSRPLPKADRARLTDAATRALRLLPAPKGYLLDRGSVHVEADPRGLWDEARSTWLRAASAKAERSFDPADEADDAPPALEQRVFVNGEVDLPRGLASAGGTLRPFPVQGAAAVMVTTIGAEGAEAGEGGRVAMPVSPEEARTAITIVRVLLADPKTERAYGAAAAAAGAGPEDTRRAPRRPGEVQSLQIEIYGGRDDVLALAKRLPTAALRKLLDSR